MLLDKAERISGLMYVKKELKKLIVYTVITLHFGTITLNP